MPIPNPVWKHVSSFSTFVYTVGDGANGNDTQDLNTLSLGNARAAVQVIEEEARDGILFIAGGNSGEHSPRPVRKPGALTEAERMREYIQYELRSDVPIITDCDREFRERFHLEPSGDTSANARNAAAVIQHDRHFTKNIQIVAERLHLPRVIATLRRELYVLGLLDESTMQGHAVRSEFDAQSDQSHLLSEDAFCRWEVKARIYSLLTRKVLSKEFLHEWITGRNYSHLHQEFIPGW